MAVNPADHEPPAPKALCLTREIIKRINGISKGMKEGEIRILVINGRFCKVRRVQDFECVDETTED